MGRAGSLYAYGGSESRAFDVTFTISLLHLLHLNTTEGIADKFTRHFSLFFADEQTATESFDLKAASLPVEEDPLFLFFEGGGYNALAEAPNWEETGFVAAQDMQVTRAWDDLTTNRDPINEAQDSKAGKEGSKPNPEGFPHAQTHRNFYAQYLKTATGVSPLPDETDSLIEFWALRYLNRLALDKVINMVYVWVNLVRATCLNNSNNTIQGPPIVRLTHGPMYNNVPCVVRDYSISILDEAGFDTQTLTPKRLEISMTLSEMRTGDFGSFEEGHVESGDNLAGWEAIINNNNIDPYNGDITQ